jgi:hypothetical protein
VRHVEEPRVTARERAAAAERWAEKERRSSRVRERGDRPTADSQARPRGAAASPEPRGAAASREPLALRAPARRTSGPAAPQPERREQPARPQPDRAQRRAQRAARRSAGGRHPDRVAALAVVMGLLFVLLAAASSRAEAAPYVHVDRGARPLYAGMAGRDVREFQRLP